MDTEIVLRRPADLVMAMDAMLKQMNRKQRKGFLQWVKQKRNQYDFQFPEGYKHKETSNDKDATGPTILTPANPNAPIIVPDNPALIIPGECVETSAVTDSTDSKPNGNPSDVVDGEKAQQA